METTFTAAIVIAAIKSRYLITFIYKGSVRTVEPHVFGTTTAGNLALRAYQLPDSAGEAEGWRLFRLDRFECAPSVCAQRFGSPRLDYRVDGDAAMSEVFASL